MLPQLVEDLVHLEGGGKRLDQDGRLDRPRLQAQRLLREEEHVVPDPRLAVTLELGEIEVGPRAARDQLVRVVKEVEAEIQKRAGNGYPVQRHVTIGEMETPGTDHEHGGLLVQPVLLPGGGIVEGELPAHGIAKIELPLDQVFPRRRGCVLEIRHEDVGAGVERVDDHLPIGRSRDLHGAVHEVVRERGDLPVLGADRSGLGQEVERLPLRETRDPLGAAIESLADARSETAGELLEEAKRLRGEHLLEARPDRSVDDERSLICLPQCHETTLTNHYVYGNNYLINNQLTWQRFVNYCCKK